MFCNKHHRHNHSYRRNHTSTNSAFEEYRRETLERLEQERSAFEGFLNRLREARDRQHFDEFMKEYKTAPKDVSPDEGAPA